MTTRATGTTIHDPPKNNPPYDNHLSETAGPHVTGVFLLYPCCLFYAFRQLWKEI